ATEIKTGPQKTIHAERWKAKAALVLVERKDLGMDHSRNHILLADNLEAMRQIESASIDLIYIDPPFNTGRTQARPMLRTIRDENGDRTGFGGRRYRTVRMDPRQTGGGRYNDSFDDFLGFLRPRMQEAYRLLTPTGSLFFHIDY